MNPTQNVEFLPLLASARDPVEAGKPTHRHSRPAQPPSHLHAKGVSSEDQHGLAKGVITEAQPSIRQGVPIKNYKYA